MRMDSQTQTQTQTQMPFDRGERFALLRASRQRIALELGRGAASAIALAEAVVGRSGGREGCTATSELLAFDLSRSTRTVRRAAAALESLGILIVEENIGGGGQRANQYAIDWDVVRRLSLKDVEPGESGPGGRNDRAPGRNDRAPGHDDRAPGHDVSAHKELSRKSPVLKEPPPPRKTEGQDAWMAVVVEVRKCGVSDAQAAVDAARSAGATAEDVQAVTSHWLARRPAWKAGALKWRIERAGEGLAADEGWPPVSEAARKQERICRNAEYAREQEGVARLEAQAKKHRDEANAAVHAEFEPKLAAMSDGELDRFAERKLEENLLMPMFRKHRLKSPLIRMMLVGAMEEEEKSSQSSAVSSQ